MNIEDKECEKCDGKGYPYQDDNIDCDECDGKGKEQLTETEKREKELMEEEKLVRRHMQMGKLDKRWFADVEIQWGCSFEAKNKEEAIEFLKEQFAQDYGITLDDSEIINIEEEGE